LLDLAKEEEDAEAEKETSEHIIQLAKKIESLEVESLFSGEADSNDCYLEIHAGAGGTESQDWAEMLLRMYLRWAESHQFKTQIIDQLAGEEAGYKSITVKVSGHNAYGWLKTESGVHRLVRISPFDSQSRRHTSFASAWVYPVIDNTIEIEIDEKDIRVDTFRASGAGGQHVNKTDSAIRITHIPTNIIVQCQDSRSQHRNRAVAMEMLKSRLYELELRKQEEERNSENAAKTEIGWGHQIRSYVLHPYQLIKDLRTNHETGNTQAVLDGDLDAFIKASLSEKIGH
jgi:peptide chain release factor 2